MNRAKMVGSGVLLLVLAAGCGGGSDDAVIEDQVRLMNDMAADYEKVTDAASWKKVQAEVEKLQPRAEELRKKEASWSEAKKKQLEQKYASELKAATEKLEAARADARKKAAGKDAS